MSENAADDGPAALEASIAAEPPDEREPARRSVDPAVLGLAALASAGAALVHAAAAGSHVGDDSVQLLFAGAAAAQLGWAALAVVRPRRDVAIVGAVVNAVAVAAWLAQRTVGLPVVEALREPEQVGTQDLLAAVLGALAVAGAALSTSARVGRRTVATGWTVAGAAAVLVLAVPAMVADHDSGGGHAHGDEAGGAAHDDSAHAAADPADEDAAGHGHGAPGAPIVSLDDERLSDDQRAVAQELIDETAPGMAGFTDVASVEAAGYTSIGDSISGYEHFINWSYLEDGRELDADAIEAVVFEVTPGGGRTLVSAMYMLDRGMTMDDVPEVAGDLTTWHDHENLCWDPAGTRLVGLVVDGRCVPTGEVWITPPMLHVWMVEHPCGPFAGIEGHGGGDDCSHHDEAAAASGAGTDL
jgi:hypothetical protein